MGRLYVVDLLAKCVCVHVFVFSAADLFAMWWCEEDLTDAVVRQLCTTTFPGSRVTERCAATHATVLCLDTLTRMRTRTRTCTRTRSHPTHSQCLALTLDFQLHVAHSKLVSGSDF